MYKHLFIILILVLAGRSKAADNVNTATGIEDERFRSLQANVRGASWDYPALMVFGSDDALTISFDELADDRSYLRLSVRHCNADWLPSALVDSEILDRFNEWIIEDYEYSHATTVPYVHYWVTIYAAEFKVSGNYVATIWRENDPDTPLLRVRFQITESSAPLNGTILTATDVDYRDAHQQLDIKADLTYALVEDPFNDLTLGITQNNRPDTYRLISHPSRASKNEAVYSHLPQLIYPGGNNYRRFETVSVTVPNLGIDYVDYIDPYYHAFVSADEPRVDKPYYYDLNLKGKYIVRERDSRDSNTEADYVVTRLSLNVPRLSQGDIYIDSDMTYRCIGPESLMKWNQQTGAYECNLLLKQGSYSYQYLYMPPGGSTGLTSTIEGDSYQTPNQYQLSLYHRRRTERFDRLIGTALLSYD